VRSVIEPGANLSACIPMAVATGGRRAVFTATLRATGLGWLFDAVVTIDEVRHGKPAPDLFLLAAERLGVVPCDCVVYEDSLQGLRAAQVAGMTAIDVTVVVR